MTEIAKQTRNKPTDFQVFSDLFAGTIQEEDLTDHQEERLNMLKSIHGMMIKATSSAQIVKKIQKIYGFSENKIFKDITLTEKVFGAARGANKAYKRKVAEEMALAIYRKAKGKGDLRAMNSALKNYIDATGCNIDDPDMPDFEKLMPSPNIVIIAQEVQDHMLLNLNKGPVRWQPDKAEGDTTTDHEELDTDAAGAD